MKDKYKKNSGGKKRNYSGLPDIKNIRWTARGFIILIFHLAVAGFATYLYINTMAYRIREFAKAGAIGAGVFSTLIYMVTVAILFPLALGFAAEAGEYPEVPDQKNTKRKKSRTGEPEETPDENIKMKKPEKKGAGEKNRASFGGALFSKDRKSRIIAWIFVLLLLIGAVTCFSIYYARKAETKNYAVAVASVDYISDGSDEDTMYWTRYTYTVNGQTYTYTSKTKSSSPKSYKNGMTEIRYNPDNPQEVYDEATAEFLLIFGIICIFIFAVCIGAVILSLNPTRFRTLVFVALIMLSVAMISYYFMSNRFAHGFFETAGENVGIEALFIFVYLSVSLLFSAVINSAGKRAKTEKNGNR